MSSTFRRLLSQNRRLLSQNRRLLSHNIDGPPKFCTAASAVNRELLEPSSPWLMLPPSFLGGRHVTYNLYSPIKRKVVSFNNRGGKRETDLMRGADGTCIVGSSHGWLAIYGQLSRDLFLLNPLSGRSVALPPYTEKEEGNGPAKVIISSSPNNDDCRALMVLGGMCEKAAFCLPGRSNKWSPLGQWYDDNDSFPGFFRPYTDVVYSAAQRRFFGFLLSGFTHREMEGWDIVDPVRPRTVRLDRLGRVDLGEPRGTYLVSGEQPDQLFLVRPCLKKQEPVGVDVYRVKDGKGLELCSSLDDLVMFVGINHSFAVKASEFPELKPNTIYFSDTRGCGGQYICVFDYQNKTCSPLYYPYLLNEHPTVRQPWFTPSLD